MKFLSIIAIVAFGAVRASYSAEVVIKEETEAYIADAYLKKAGRSEKRYLPIENDADRDGGIARWKDIAPGKYRLCLNPGYGDFSDHCIVVSDITITKGSNTFNVRLPDGRVGIEVKLQGVTPPTKDSRSLSFWFRVDRIDKDGRCDPDYVQWLSTKLKDGIYTGGHISRLAPGTYRIVAFHNDKYPNSRDIGYGINKDPDLRDLGHGIIEVTEEVLKGGKAMTVIVKPVEEKVAKPSVTPPKSRTIQ